jgi:hypothetical protein
MTIPQTTLRDPAWPVRLLDPSEPNDGLGTPPAFRGFWLHMTTVKPEISANGWKPQRMRNSIYGAAIYLARGKWSLEHLPRAPVIASALKKLLKDQQVFVCTLVLQEHEAKSLFPSASSPEGYTETDLLAHLNEHVPHDPSKPRGIRRVIPGGSPSTALRFTRNAGLGSNTQNREIAAYFLARGIKAIKFFEHDADVVAVFDASCIRVVPASVDLEADPYPTVLAAARFANDHQSVT